jgi:hypothetical protein
MQAGATITAQYKYVGGMEGVSHYGWYLHEVSLRWETLLFSLCCRSLKSGLHTTRTLLKVALLLGLNAFVEVLGCDRDFQTSLLTAVNYHLMYNGELQ